MLYGWGEDVKDKQRFCVTIAVIFVIAVVLGWLAAQLRQNLSDNGVGEKSVLAQIDRHVNSATRESSKPVPWILFDLFQSRPEPRASFRGRVGYHPSDDPGAMAFMRGVLAYIQQRDPAADAQAAADAGVFDLFFLRGRSHGMYMQTFHLPVQTINAGVACIGAGPEASRPMKALVYKIYVAGGGVTDASKQSEPADPESDYLIEADILKALSGYVRSYNRALLAKPSFPYPHVCREVPKGPGDNNSRTLGGQRRLYQNANVDTVSCCAFRAFKSLWHKIFRRPAECAGRIWIDTGLLRYKGRSS